MMKSNRDFDIITGTSNTIMAKRAYSQVEPSQRLNHIRPLGSPRDQNLFQYAYFDRLQPLSSRNPQPPRAVFPPNSQLDTSMLNCVSTPYNIINHSGQHVTSKVVSHEMFSLKLPEVNKKSPLTVHLKAGRIFSPNYRADYPEREARHEFHMKSHGFLDDICENEKRSVGRYFRKYK